MKITKETYNQYKTIVEEAYLEMFDKIHEAVQQDVEGESTGLEASNITYDLMISKMIGMVVSYDEVHKQITRLHTERCPICNEPKNGIIQIHHHN